MRNDVRGHLSLGAVPMGAQKRFPNNPGIFKRPFDAGGSYNWHLYRMPQASDQPRLCKLSGMVLFWYVTCIFYGLAAGQM